ncbi:MAG: nucleoside hydrolase [Chloroflexota bacterium]|nr:nucleoside hydrolase [Chloroflexota bacterium]
MQKIILDTDIGSDIDDALCLAYLLAQPQCELLGITTVSGQPTERAKLASALCYEAGKGVPIYPGVEQPLLATQRQPACPQSSMLERWRHDTSFPQNAAIDFLRQTIRVNPHEITLLAIGPMTNIALLFAVDPEIPSLLKGLTMMVGMFGDGADGTAQFGEWNAICDPHAIAMLYNTPVTAHRSVGLDVTLQVTMNADEVRQRFQKGLLRPVLDFAEVWFQERPVITFHDPLAAATLFDDGICVFRRGSVTVELANAQTAGLTRWQAGDGGHQVALKVDKERFFEHYFSVF